jgi:hypothetical protein
VLSPVRLHCQGCGTQETQSRNLYTLWQAAIRRSGWEEEAAQTYSRRWAAAGSKRTIMWLSVCSGAKRAGILAVDVTRLQQQRASRVSHPTWELLAAARGEREEGSQTHQPCC